MPRWLKFIRGMIGTGLTFAIGIGGFTGILGAIALLRGRATFIEVLQDVGRFSVVSFILGAAFAGVLALVARGGRLQKLSIKLGAALGAGAGTLYWTFLAMTGGRVWTPRLALGNFVLLVAMGATAGAATLLIARKAGLSSLTSRDQLHELSAGDDEFTAPRNKSKTTTRVDDDESR